jgi:CHAT domain-containing protein
MGLFYKNILEGDSYFKALRKAQLIMKAKYPNPAIWAAFELIGE